MPRVPNYRLQARHAADPAFAAKATGLSFWQALRAPSFTLFDEVRGRMVRFPAASDPAAVRYVIPPAGPPGSACRRVGYAVRLDRDAYWADAVR